MSSQFSFSGVYRCGGTKTLRVSDLPCARGTRASANALHVDDSTRSVLRAHLFHLLGGQRLEHLTLLSIATLLSLRSARRITRSDPKRLR